MEYNTTRNHLIIPEYGRNVQKMIETAIEEPDFEKRTRMAYAIVDVMARIHPHYKDKPEFRQKLWDHLIIISNFRLDVNGPYPKPIPQSEIPRPQKLNYPNKYIAYRHYGKNIERIIEKVISLEDGAYKAALIKNIANYLKKSYLSWNRDSVNDELIYKHFEEMSGGNLQLSEGFQLANTRSIIHNMGQGKKKNIPAPTNNGKYGQNRNNKNNPKNGYTPKK